MEKIKETQVGRHNDEHAWLIPAQAISRHCDVHESFLVYMSLSCTCCVCSPLVLHAILPPSTSSLDQFADGLQTNRLHLPFSCKAVPSCHVLSPVFVSGAIVH